MSKDHAAQISAKLMLKAELFDYICWLETVSAPECLHGIQHLVLASDGTTCWAKTYADAVRVAMEHDKELYDATPLPAVSSKEGAREG